MEVVVETADGVEPPFEPAWFERVANAAVTTGAQAAVGEAVQVVFLLTDDVTLHDLNLRFRHVDEPTDVLSFEGETEASSPACAMGHLGDVALSVERARRQAEDYGHTFEREVAYLLTHGVLHLLGYDQRRMRAAEERALQSIGLSRVAGEGARASGEKARRGSVSE